jgi:[ribosomal protein S5]-alanine N-acetyltransferase
MAPSRPPELTTRRLILRPATVPLLQAELAGTAALARALGAVVGEGWPPGQHTFDAVRYFLEHPEQLAEGWADYYVIHKAQGQTPATLVASIGYQSDPNPAGRVEVGYSVVVSWRGRGIATEAVSAMVEKAQAHGLRAVIAHALPHNHASIAVLTKNRFRPAPSTREGELGFERRLYAVRRARPDELSAVNERYARIDFQPSSAADVQLVIDAGGDLAGLGRLVPIAPGLLELGGIWVDESLRGDGAARAIVSALVAASAGRAMACIPFSKLEAFYGSFGFVRWDRAKAPAKVRDKLEFCERTYDQPVCLMHRPGE